LLDPLTSYYERTSLPYKNRETLPSDIASHPETLPSDIASHPETLPSDIPSRPETLPSDIVSRPEDLNFDSSITAGASKQCDNTRGFIHQVSSKPKFFPE